MRVTMLWHGGSNYAVPTEDDGETFASLKDAKAAFWRRADFDPRFPCVENSEAWIYFGGTVHDNGPDRILRIGTRGGVVVERG